jgi:hypothetical protein
MRLTAKVAVDPSFADTVQDVKPVITPTVDVEKTKASLKEVENPVKLNVQVQNQEKISAVKKELVDLSNNSFVATVTALVDQAKSGLQSVNNELNALPTSKTIDVNIRYNTQGNPPSQFANKGGLIGSIQHFAEGGVAKFKELASSFIPGTGDTDTVPAMLTPGEYVIKKDRVKDLGVGFLNALNDGLIQFKSLGGMVYNAPVNTLNAMSSYIQPNYSMGQQMQPVSQTPSSPSIDINLTIRDEKFNIKTPRDQVDGLVSALKHLNRTL